MASPDFVPVRFTGQCERRYSKNRKKYSPELVKSVDSIMRNLSTDQTLGKPLVEDLKGFRTVRIGRFSYRLVFTVKNLPEPVVVVYLIDHRSRVYSEMSRIRRTIV